jgi:hypothetical protein
MLRVTEVAEFRVGQHERKLSVWTLARTAARAADLHVATAPNKPRPDVVVANLYAVGRFLGVFAQWIVNRS